LSYFNAYLKGIIRIDFTRLVKESKTAGGNRRELASGIKRGRLGGNCVYPLFE
jgi:hypothetical protein